MWSNVGHESCPILFPALLRAWSFSLGGSDTALRLFGFIVGVSMLGAVWLNGWFLHRSVPLISLALLAVNPSVVRWGDSLRAYGLASVLMVVTLAMVWCFVRAPDLKRWLVAALVATINVQCLFQNSFLLLAVCAAAAAVMTRRKDFKNALIALAIGVPAALSLLPYGMMIRQAQDWSVLSQIGFVPALIWTNLSLAMAPTVSWLRWIWVVLAVVAIARCIKSVAGFSPSEAPENNPHTAALFAGTAGRGADRLLHFLADCEDADAGMVFFAAHNLYCGLHRRRASELARALAGLALGFSGSCARFRSRARVN